MGSFVYVGNLAPTTTEDSVRNAFTAAGKTIKGVTILRNPQNDRSRGFGFVEVGSDEEIAAAILSMNGVEVDGRKLAVNHVKASVPHARNDGRSFESYSGLGGRTSSGPRRSGGSKRKSR